MHKEDNPPELARISYLATAFLVVLFAFAISLVWTLGARSYRKRHLLHNQFPDISLIDSTSRSLRARDLFTSPLSVVAFVSPTCPHCKVELSTLDSLLPSYRSSVGFYVVSPSERAKVDTIRSNFPSLQVYGTAQSEFQQTGLTKVPEVLFLRNGVIESIQEGERTPDEERILFESFLARQR